MKCFRLTKHKALPSANDYTILLRLCFNGLSCSYGYTDREVIDKLIKEDSITFEYMPNVHTLLNSLFILQDDTDGTY